MFSFLQAFPIAVGVLVAGGESLYNEFLVALISGIVSGIATGCIMALLLWVFRKSERHPHQTPPSP